MRYPHRVSTALPETLHAMLSEYATKHLLHPSTVARQAIAYFLAAKTRNVGRGKA